MAVAERTGRVMASELQLLAIDPPMGGLDDAVRYLDRLEAHWSRFLPDSDIARLNAADGEAVTVDDDTVVLVATMVEAWRLTAGGYDPTLLHELVANGYPDRSRGATVAAAGPAPERPVRTTARPCPADVAIDAAYRTVRLPGGMALDPGGIGKGLAADLVVARLLARGAAGALVSVGGDLAMGGVAPTAAGWLVAVEHPEPTDGVLTTLAVGGGGVATSSTRSRRWVYDGRQRHHQIDPRSGEPSSTDLAAITVIARSGWMAEAHATAALARGSSDVLAYLSAHGLDGLAVTGDGTVLRTENLR